jgi:hypothetical protein
MLSTYTKDFFWKKIMAQISQILKKIKSISPFLKIIFFINSLVCLSVEVPKSRSRSWNRGPAVCPGLIPGVFFSSFSGGLPRVNTRVFFSRPFPMGCPRLIPSFFIYLFLFLFFPAGSLCRRRTCPGFFFKKKFCPFLARFAVYGRTGLCIFEMDLPRVNIRVFFFFSHPFPAGCLGFYYIYYYFRHYLTILLRL